MAGCCVDCVVRLSSKHLCLANSIEMEQSQVNEIFCDLIVTQVRPGNGLFACFSLSSESVKMLFF